MVDLLRAPWCQWSHWLTLARCLKSVGYQLVNPRDSAIYPRIAAPSARAKSPSWRVGTNPAGLIFKKDSVLCSPIYFK